MHRIIRWSVALIVACLSCAIAHSQSPEAAPGQGATELPFDSKPVIAKLAALPPDKPVKLGLDSGAKSSVRELVALIDHYHISRMTLIGLNAAFLNKPFSSPSTAYQNRFFELDFTAAGPNLQSQLDRAECIIAARFQEPTSDNFKTSYVELSGIWHLSTTIQLASSEAARLVKSLPAPITRVVLWPDDGLDSVTMIETATTKKIQEQVRIRYNAKIPPACDKYISLEASP